MSQPAVSVGIDVAQATLVVAVCRADTPDTPAANWTVPNDPAGVATLQRQLRRQQPALIVLEAPAPGATADRGARALAATGAEPRRRRSGPGAPG